MDMIDFNTAALFWFSMGVLACVGVCGTALAAIVALDLRFEVRDAEREEG